MSAYPPVTRIPAIFNPTLYGVDGAEDYLTLGQADARYLKLTGGNLTGQLTINNDLSADDIFVNDGSVSNPSFSFRDDTDTGLYSSSNGVIDFTNNGNNTLTISTSATRFLDGSVSVPSISFITDTDTGFFHEGGFSPTISVAVSGTNSFTFGEFENYSTRLLRILDGTLSQPSIAFISEANTGLYRSQSNRLDFAVNGNHPLSLRNTDTYVLGDLHIPTGAVNGYVLTSNGSGKASWVAPTSSNTVSLLDGTTTTPSLNFLNNTNLGIRRVSPNTMGFVSAGLTAINFDFAGFYPTVAFASNLGNALNPFQFIYSGRNYVSDGTTSNPSISFIDDTNTGLYRPTTDELGVVTGGLEVARFRTAGFRVKDIEGGSTTNNKNYLRMTAGGNVQRFFRFRTGNTPTTKCGITISAFDTNNFHIYNSGSLRFDWTNNPEETTLNTGVTLFRFDTDGSLVGSNQSGSTRWGLSGLPTSDAASGIFVYGNTTNDFVKIRHDGTHGFLELPSGSTGDIYIGQALGTRLVYNVATTYPSVSGVMDLGQVSRRFRTIYLVNSPNVSSSETIKKDIGVCCGLRFINKLKPKTYRYVFDGDDEPLRYGLIAEEVKQVLVENNMSFRGLTEDKDEEGEIQYGIAYQDFVAPLIKSVQELDIKCVSLENENETLKSKVSTLETTLQSVLERLTILEQQQQQSTNI